MVEIKCLVCGGAIGVPGFIDANNYDGQVACPECGSLLYIRLVGNKARKYTVAERKPPGSAPTGSCPGRQAAAAEPAVEDIARYNPLRDFLATYRASRLQLAFEQIEAIIGAGLETAAYTLKSWWDNDKSHPQAIAWLEAGWEVVDVVLEQRQITLKRMAQP